MNYDINEFLSVRQGECKKNAWEEIEKKIGIIFPEDYKMFIDFHGERGINDFLWILSPFSENENLNSTEMQFTVPSGLHSVLERPFSEINGRPFLVKRSPLIVC